MAVPTRALPISSRMTLWLELGNTLRCCSKEDAELSRDAHFEEAKEAMLKHYVRTEPIPPSVVPRSPWYRALWTRLLDVRRWDLMGDRPVFTNHRREGDPMPRFFMRSGS